MTRSTGWPDGLAEPESLTNDLTDVQEHMVGESHNLIIPRHFQTWLNWGEWRWMQGGLKVEKDPRGNDTAKERERVAAYLASNLLF